MVLEMPVTDLMQYKLIHRESAENKKGGNNMSFLGLGGNNNVKYRSNRIRITDSGKDRAVKDSRNSVLVCLMTEGSRTPAEIARQLGMDERQVVNVVKYLAKKGWVAIPNKEAEEYESEE